MMTNENKEKKYTQKCKRRDESTESLKRKWYKREIVNRRKKKENEE